MLFFLASPCPSNQRIPTLLLESFKLKAKIETYIRVMEDLDKPSQEGAIATAIDVTSTINATSMVSNLNGRRPFPGRPQGRPHHPFPAGFNVPISPHGPKSPPFAIATQQRPAASPPGYPKPAVLPTSRDPTATRATAQRHPVTVHTATAGSNPAIISSNELDDTTESGDRGATGSDSGASGHGGGNGTGADLLGGREHPTSTPTDHRTSRRLDLITAFLPLLAAIAFAPIVGLVFFVLHRKCTRHGRTILTKNLSQKVPANKTISAETTITASEIDYNGSLFNQMRSKRAFSNRYESNSDFIASPFVLPPKEDREWEFPRHHLMFKDILGEGCFGQVWRCEATNICNSEGPQTVAVKTLKENASEKEKAEFLSELEIMKVLDPHPNVVTLLGCCADKEPVFLIMEYVPFGKLQSFLRDNRAERFYNSSDGCLTSRDLTSFAYQIAKGMEYISSKGVSWCSK